MFSRKTIEVTEVNKVDILLNDAGYIDLILRVMKPRLIGGNNSILYNTLTYEKRSHRLMCCAVGFTQTVVILSLPREKSNENQ